MKIFILYTNIHKHVLYFWICITVYVNSSNTMVMIMWFTPHIKGSTSGKCCPSTLTAWAPSINVINTKSTSPRPTAVLCFDRQNVTSETVVPTDTWVFFFCLFPFSGTGHRNGLKPSYYPVQIVVEKRRGQWWSQCLAALNPKHLFSSPMLKSIKPKNNVFKNKNVAQSWGATGHSILMPTVVIAYSDCRNTASVFISFLERLA